MWYVVQTADGKEIDAIEKCQRAIPGSVATAIFSPHYEYMRKYQGVWHVIEAVLFPGYVFIESEQAQELERYLEHIAGVVTPVCIGGGFYPIRRDEEEFLRSMFDETYCIRYSLGYIVDEKLIVEHGPLYGKTQYITRIDRHKRIADFKLHLFDKERKVKVGLEVPARLTSEEYQKMKSTA